VVVTTWKEPCNQTAWVQTAVPHVPALATLDTFPNSFIVSSILKWRCGPNLRTVVRIK
jgi:hypothetical protein